MSTNLSQNKESHFIKHKGGTSHFESQNIHQCFPSPSIMKQCINLILVEELKSKIQTLSKNTFKDFYKPDKTIKKTPNKPAKQ
uniref:Putative ovule protein n=1 Tax=Solanum chacoense TaxID=4108 RepID=A0A0V0HBS7_SOLCH